MKTYKIIENNKVIGSISIEEHLVDMIENIPMELVLSPAILRENGENKLIDFIPRLQ